MSPKPQPTRAKGHDPQQTRHLNQAGTWRRWLSLWGIGSLTALLLTAGLDLLNAPPDLAGGGGRAEAQPVPARTRTGPDDFRPQRVVPPFPPITEFDLRPAQQVAPHINPTELVLGVTVNDQSRAYPINMLTGPRREIINDRLGGRSIAATW